VTISGSSPNRKYRLREPLRAAWEKVGVSYIPDGNAGSPLGVAEMTENWKVGNRQMAKDAYDLSGVQTITEALVQRVIIETRNGEKVATGVQLAGEGGRVISAKKEVIVSAGAYRTPQILMLSGIGPQNELSAHGITQIVDAPEVGNNFYDHLTLCQWWKLRHPEQGQAFGTPLWTDPSYFLGKPMDWIVFSQTPQEQLKKALEIDDDSTGMHIPDVSRSVEITDSSLADNDYLVDPKCCHTETLVIYVPTGEITGLALPIVCPTFSEAFLPIPDHLRVIYS